MSYRPVPTTEEEDSASLSKPARSLQFTSPTHLLLVISAFVLVFLGFQLGKWYSFQPEQVDQSIKNSPIQSIGHQIELPNSEMSPREKLSVA
jgi:hypothetical protein